MCEKFFLPGQNVICVAVDGRDVRIAIISLNNKYWEHTWRSKKQWYWQDISLSVTEFLRVLLLVAIVSIFYNASRRNGLEKRYTWF